MDTILSRARQSGMDVLHQINEFYDRLNISMIGRALLLTVSSIYYALHIYHDVIKIVHNT